METNGVKAQATLTDADEAAESNVHTAANTVTETKYNKAVNSIARVYGGGRITGVHQPACPQQLELLADLLELDESDLCAALRADTRTRELGLTRRLQDKLDIDNETDPKKREFNSLRIGDRIVFRKEPCQPSGTGTEKGVVKSVANGSRKMYLSVTRFRGKIPTSVPFSSYVGRAGRS